MENASKFHKVLKGYFPLVSRFFMTSQKDSLSTNGHHVFIIIHIRQVNGDDFKRLHFFCFHLITEEITFNVHTTSCGRYSP